MTTALLTIALSANLYLTDSLTQALPETFTDGMSLKFAGEQTSITHSASRAGTLSPLITWDINTWRYFELRESTDVFAGQKISVTTSLYRYDNARDRGAIAMYIANTPN